MFRKIKCQIKAYMGLSFSCIILACIFFMNGALAGAVSLDDGLALYQSEEYAQAKAKLQEYIEQNPDAPYVNRAKVKNLICSFYLGDYQYFLTESAGILLDNDSLSVDLVADLKLHQALAQYELKKPIEAQSGLKKVLILYPGTEYATAAQFHLANILYWSGKYPEARAAFDAFISQHPDEYVNASYFHRAMSMFWDQQYVAARQALLEYIRIRPNGTHAQEATFQAAMASLFAKDWKQAETELVKFATTFPQSRFALDAYYNSATASLYLQDWENARNSFKSFIQHSTDTAKVIQATFLSAKTHFQEAKWDEAIVAMDEFAKVHPASEYAPEAEFLHAMALCWKSKSPESAIALRKFSNKYPNSQFSLEAQFQATMVPYSKGKWAQAQAELEDFLKLNPGAKYSESASYCLAMARFWQSKSAQTRDAFLLFVEKYPESSHVSDAIFQAAMVLYWQGSWEAARNELNSYIIKFPTAKNVLAAKRYAVSCSYELAHYSQSIAEMGALLNDPSLPTQASDQLGFLLATIPHKYGDWRDSIEYLEKYAKEHPTSEYRRNAELLLAQAQLQVSNEMPETSQTIKQAYRVNAESLLKTIRQEVEGKLAKETDPGAIFGLNGMLFESYYYEGQYDQLTSATEKFRNACALNSKEWGFATIWQAVGLIQKGNYPSAKIMLESIIKSNMQDSNIAQHIPTIALYWRIVLATMEGDKAGELYYLDKLVQEMPNGPVKTHAMVRFADLLH